jgi:hypothetical protein
MEGDNVMQNQGYLNTANWQIADAMRVYATDGDKLGTVRNYNPQAGYLDVRKGWLFVKDFYVLIDDVDTVAEDGITLKLTRNELDDDRYSVPPTSTAPAPEPVVLADGSVVGTGAARKQPVEGAGTDDSYRPTAGDTGTDTPELAGDLREERRFRAR